LAPGNSCLKLFPAYMYCALPSGNTPSVPLKATSHPRLGEAYQGNGFDVQGRSANSSVNSEAPHSTPAPNRLQNKSFSLVFLSKQRF
jgi:hypothetical protein